MLWFIDVGHVCENVIGETLTSVHPACPASPAANLMA